MSHTTLSNNKLLCRGCGASYDLFKDGKPIAIWEMVALTKGFEQEHVGCAPDNESELRCSLCNGSGHDYEGCNAAHGYTKETWISGHDTGISSTTIWCFMTGSGFGRLNGFGPWAPSDPDDFGRCYRLLLLAPEWRARMPEMASLRTWSKMAPAWEELTALFEEERTRSDGKAPKLYARMKELTW